MWRRCRARFCRRAAVRCPRLAVTSGFRRRHDYAHPSEVRESSPFGGSCASLLRAKAGRAASYRISPGGRLTLSSRDSPKGGWLGTLHILHMVDRVHLHVDCSSHLASCAHGAGRDLERRCFCSTLVSEVPNDQAGVYRPTQLRWPPAKSDCVRTPSTPARRTTTDP